jgi:thiol-disulfide isomerase/thioredoxin
MPSRMMPLAVLALMGVAILWMTRSPNGSPDLDKNLAVVTAADVLKHEAGAKAILVNFWATWCEPCIREIPAFIEVEKALGPTGLKVVLVNLETQKPQEEIKDYSARLRATHLTVIKSPQDGFFRDLGIDAPSILPYTALFNVKTGRWKTWVGERTRQQLELEVKAVLQ